MLMIARARSRPDFPLRFTTPNKRSRPVFASYDRFPIKIDS